MKRLYHIVFISFSLRNCVTQRQAVSERAFLHFKQCFLFSDCKGVQELQAGDDWIDQDGGEPPHKATLPLLSSVQWYIADVILQYPSYIICHCFVNAQNDETGPDIPRLKCLT